MTGALTFLVIVAVIYLIDRMTRKHQPSAPYLANAASLEHARPLSADERLAQWAAAYFAGGHHREIR